MEDIHVVLVYHMICIDLLFQLFVFNCVCFSPCSRDSDVGFAAPMPVGDSSGDEGGASTHWPHPPTVQNTAKQLASDALQNATADVGYDDVENFKYLWK